jgi:hypothetical protein
VLKGVIDNVTAISFYINLILWLSGLEGDDDTPVVKKTEVPKKKTSQSPVLENVTAPKSTTPPKRVLQQSDVFMAAFDDVEKKPPAKKKMKINKVVKVLQPDVPEKNSPTVKSEWDVSYHSVNTTLSDQT